MPEFQPRDPAYAERVAEAFRDESAASKWGGELRSISPGVAEVTLGNPGGSRMPTGPIHRSYLAALLDDSCLLAALSLTSPGDLVRTVEYKVNYLSVTTGECVVARAEVVRPGRSITVCRAGAYADGRLVARMLATLAVSRPA